MTTINVRNPYTGEQDFSFRQPSADELAKLCDALREAQPEWAALGLDRRIAVLERFAQAVQNHRDDILARLSEDTGRVGVAIMETDGLPRKIQGDIASARQNFREVDDAPAAFPGLSGSTRHAPYALVGNITPWNFPLSLSFLDTVQPLLAGCAVILKPSEITPRFVGAINAALDEVPELARVLTILPGDGRVGAAIVANVDYLCFTGSVATGRRILEEASRRFIPVSLELGGKDPAIVLDDAPLAAVASNVALSSCLASGQICTSTERVYVPASQHDEFLQHLSGYARRMQINHPDIAQGFVGPFILDRQADTVREHIDDAVAQGARVLTGGKIIDHGGLWLEPTVLADVNHDMRVMREETFGPVMPVMAYASGDEAVALANDSDYGLNATVFGGDAERAKSVARRLNAGGVSVNMAGAALQVRDFEQDAYGFSGIGRNRIGPEGFLRFFRRKAIVSSDAIADDTHPIAQQAYSGPA